MLGTARWRERACARVLVVAGETSARCYARQRLPHTLALFSGGLDTMNATRPHNFTCIISSQRRNASDYAHLCGASAGGPTTRTGRALASAAKQVSRKQVSFLSTWLGQTFRSAPLATVCRLCIVSILKIFTIFCSRKTTKNRAVQCRSQVQKHLGSAQKNQKLL